MRIFKLVDTGSTAEFVAFWSQRYWYNNSQLYDGNIGRPLNVARIWQLYEWKNGKSNIARPKRRCIEAIYVPQLKALPVFRNHLEGRAYVERLHGGAIWNIFWLHCLNRSLFPIFDQHTYRAMASMLCLRTREIPTAKGAKIKMYFEQYIPFLTSRFAGQEDRLVDKALFTYGRFLKSHYAEPA